MRMGFEWCMQNTLHVAWLIVVPFHFLLKYKKNDHLKSELIALYGMAQLVGHCAVL